MKIVLPSRVNQSFGSGIYFLLFNIIDPISEALKNRYTEIRIDASACQFLTPIVIAPLATLNYHFSREKNILTIYLGANDFARYSKVIHFPNGFKPESIQGSNYEDFFSSYLNKTYIPIINFPAEQSFQETSMRDNVLQALHLLLARQLKLATNFHTSLCYLLDEMVNNIKDHSNATRGFVFAQYYPQQQYLDICITDNGKGILRSYTQNGFLEFNHSQAIRAAISGISTKSELGRGFGIRTSINMLVEGLNGYFFLMSGNSHFIKSKRIDQISELPENLNWQGTIVSLRIPFKNQNFDYLKYLE